MCSPSPVALRARSDCLAAVLATHDLGIVRDASRCAERRSAHCCGDRAESPAARKLNVVLAWDCGHAVGDRKTAAVVRDAFLADPRVDYVISFGVLYKPDGSTQRNTGHEDHVHVTFDPSAANDTRPFNFTATDPGGFGTMDDKEILEEFANVTKREGALLDALVDKITEQAQKHNTAARERDAKLLAALERIEAKLP